MSKRVVHDGGHDDHSQIPQCAQFIHCSLCKALGMSEEQVPRDDCNGKDKHLMPVEDYVGVVCHPFP
jgi:hypothetical protein